MIVSAGTTNELTFMVIEFEVAVVGEAHAFDEVRIHVTTSPLASVELLNVLPVPTSVPFTCH